MPEKTVELLAQLKCKSCTFWFEPSKWTNFRFISFKTRIQRRNLSRVKLRLNALIKLM